MKIYLNNAATSYPKPACVREAVYNALSGMPGDANRGGITGEDVFARTREHIGVLIGAESPDRIAIAANATAALNAGIFGAELKTGDTVLTSLSEHNSVLRPLYKLRENGVKIVFAECDRYGRIDTDDWRAKIFCCEPKLCVFTHASNVTGAVNDAAELCGCAKEHGALTLLDASQTAGLYDIAHTGADMIALTGHKYLLGPQGSGALYVSAPLKLRPHLFGGTGIFSDSENMPEDMPLRLEAGTGNEPAAAGLAAALEWARKKPNESGRLAAMCSYLKNGLKSAGMNVIEPEGSVTPVVSFTAGNMTAADTGFILTEGCGIICRSGLHCAPLIHSRLKYNAAGTVRLSLSRFTTQKELDYTIGAVRDAADWDKKLYELQMQKNK